MIKIQYTKIDAILTIQECLDHYINTLNNVINNGLTHPKETIYKSIANDLLIETKKIVFTNTLKPITGKKQLKLKIQEAHILVFSFLNFQQSIISPNDPVHYQVENLKQQLHPQTV